MSAHESVFEDRRTVARREGRGSLALWFAVLGSPLAWFSHLIASYSLEEWFACAPATTDRGEVLGFGVDAVVGVLTVVFAAVAAASGLTALLCLRRSRATEPAGRARWMAYAGAVVGAVFLAAILLGAAPPLILDTCATTP